MQQRRSWMHVEGETQDSPDLYVCVCVFQICGTGLEGGTTEFQFG